MIYVEKERTHSRNHYSKALTAILTTILLLGILSTWVITPASASPEYTIQVNDEGFKTHLDDASNEIRYITALGSGTVSDPFVIWYENRETNQIERAVSSSDEDGFTTGTAISFSTIANTLGDGGVNHPAVVEISGGRLGIYFWAGHAVDSLSFSISTDGGLTWSDPVSVDISGIPYPPSPPGDPHYGTFGVIDAVEVGGRIRLYFVDNFGDQSIRVVESELGLTGDARYTDFDGANGRVVLSIGTGGGGVPKTPSDNPDTVQYNPTGEVVQLADGTWALFYIAGDDGYLGLAQSADGLTGWTVSRGPSNPLIVGSSLDHTDIREVAAVSLDSGSFGLLYDAKFPSVGTEKYVGYSTVTFQPPPSEVWVDAVNGNDANPGTEAEPFATIQEGIDTVAEGGTVHVAAGTYDEQVVIDKSLILEGEGDATIIKPSSVTGGWSTYAGGPASATGIVVANAGGVGVTVKNLKVDGSAVTSAPGGTGKLIGVFYRDTGGIIDDVTVTMTPPGSSPKSCGIWASTPSQTVAVEIKNCHVSIYCKNGITANEVGLTANIHHNTVTGSGPRTDVAQNGIQIGYGATGSIDENEVSNNAYTGEYWTACGIMLWNWGGTVTITGNTVADCQAGIATQAGSGSRTVTISGNTVNAAGLAGQGVPDVVGINVATWADGASIDATIEDNDLTGGGPGNGIETGSISEYGPAGTVNALITNNEVSGWWHGIWLGLTSNEVTITGNTITDNILVDSGVHIISGVDVSNIHVNFNNIEENVDHGVFNGGTGTLDAENNWWDDESGPYHPTDNPDGLGDKVSDNVDFDPWIGAGVEDSTTQNVPDHVTDYEVDAESEADTDVFVDTTTGTPSVTVAKYESNPGTGFAAGKGSIGKYIDVHLDDDTGVTKVEIRLYYTDAEVRGLVESSLKMYWWDGTAWVVCSNTGVNTAQNYIWAVIGTTSIPNLDQLSGQGFGGGGNPTPAKPVGGEVFPVNKLGLMMPYIAAMLVIATGAAIIKKRRY